MKVNAITKQSMDKKAAFDKANQELISRLNKASQKLTYAKYESNEAYDEAFKEWKAVDEKYQEAFKKFN